jgi:futalosine hydrolase
MSSQCQWLVVVPTRLEMRQLSRTIDRPRCQFELCGFGAVVAAARTALLIEKWKPEMVMLCGIAGSYSSELPTGEAFLFRRVAAYGIGAGQGQSFLTADQMGWSQWEQEGIRLGDELELQAFADEQPSTRDLLVSVSAASTNRIQVEDKKRIYPAAAAEEMEGFSVAVAARLAGLPACIIRGISNRAGDRRTDQWQVEKAMQSVDQLAQRVMEQFR